MVAFGGVSSVFMEIYMRIGAEGAAENYKLFYFLRVTYMCAVT